MRIRIRGIRFIVAAFLALAFWSSGTFAQQVNSGTESGFPPYGSFSGSSFDTVLLENGNLHVEMPIVSVKERNRTFTWKFAYDAPGWEKIFTPTPTKQNRNLGFYSVYPTQTGGWSTSSPAYWYGSSASITATCPTTGNPYTYYTNYYLQDPDGTKHQFPFYKEGDGTHTVCNGNNLSGPALDGSGISWNLQTGIAILKDGTQIKPTQEITDTNGNMASGSSDMLDRNVLRVTQGSNVACTTPLGKQEQCPQYTYTYLDSNGKSQSYQLEYGAFDVQTNLCGNIIGGNKCYEYAGYQIEPVKLILPDGLSYTFSYENDSLLQLTEIGVPTGGSITYTYTSIMVAQPDGGHYPNYMGIAAVLSRTVKADGTSNEWTYGGYGDGSTSEDVTVTDPLDNQQVHSFSKVGVGTSTSASLVETSATYYQGSSGSGKLLRTVTKAWTGEPDPNNTLVNLRITSETTKLDNGQENQIQTDYETFQYNDPASGLCPCTATRSNATEKREYDYGSGAPGSLLRRTDYTYLHTNNQTYLNLNIVDRVTGITTYNGSGTQVAQTTNEYDNYTQTIQTTNAVSHSSSFNYAYKTRGNLTAITRWRNTDGKLLTTRNQYNDVGEIISATDPLNNVTSFDYTDSWANSTCVPSGGSAAAYIKKITNALNQSTSFTYESCTGVAASSTDENSQTTSHTFDLFSRILTTSYPDRGSTADCYTDDSSGQCYSGSLPLKVITTTAITSGMNLVHTTVYDDLGRISQTQVNSDPEGVDYTETTYDADGRTASVSNPYRSTSDPTYGVTSYGYDALNRTTLVTKQDGSKVTTSYSGNSTTVTDEAGKTRESFVDGLGRMAEVIENPGGLNYVTNYAYDALDNLTDVTQAGSRQRFFDYDSLSRLTSLLNPESGVINYSYDADGNVQTRTDARGIVTTYTYDALNRLTKKSYSDGTPTAQFLYDADPGWGYSETNIAGRMTEAWANISGTSVGASIFSYDSMGRVIMNDQCTPIICGSGAFGVDYQYDLLGDMTSATGNGVQYTGTYTYDSAARLTQITSSLNDAQHPPTLFTVSSHWPTGAPEMLKYGNNLAELNFYNDRLQPCRININTGTPALSSCSSSVASGTVQDFYVNYNEGSSDNGNVMEWAASDNQVFRRTYTHDQVNRLTSMADADNVATCLGATWTYDTWGNRLTQTPTKGACGSWNQSYNANNRISGWSYDASGNLLNDGSHSYTYDAENRITTVDGGATASYVYDGLGRRVRKTIGSFSTDYIYGLSGEVITEMTTGCSPNCWSKGYIYGDGGLVAEYASGTTYFAHRDHLGSTRLMTQMNGTIYDSLDFMPYGEQIAGETGTTHKFEGHERDGESGLDDFGARFYSSQQGRFMSADWSAVPVAVPYANLTNPQTLNLYAIVRDNPITFADLDGHEGTEHAGAPASETNCKPTSPAGITSCMTTTSMPVIADDDQVAAAETAQAQQQNTSTVVVEQVKGEGGNALGHVAIGINGATPVGLVPDSDKAAIKALAKEVASAANGTPEASPVPGHVESLSANRAIKAKATIHVTPQQAAAMQKAIKGMAGRQMYDPAYRNCASFVEQVLRSGGVKAPNDITPGGLVGDLNKQFPQ
ncbi:MAG: RHS repeat domain-containing protein [Candidatus Acidiferrales bacterium]